MRHNTLWPLGMGFFPSLGGLPTGLFISPDLFCFNDFLDLGMEELDDSEDFLFFDEEIPTAGSEPLFLCLGDFDSLDPASSSVVELASG